jgi:hypothetical protein
VHVAVQQLGADREMKGFGSRPRVQPAAEPEVVAQRLHSGGVQRDQPGLAVLAGILEIDAAFGAGELAGMRAMFVLGGVVLAAFGVSLLARPGMGAPAATPRLTIADRLASRGEGTRRYNRPAVGTASGAAP